MTNCLICGATNFCSLCLGSFTANTAGACVLCEAPCSSCNSNGTCATCAAPFNTVPASNGTCVSCQDPFCLSCNPNKVTNCLSCALGYNLQNGQCTMSCSSNTCLQCSSSNNAACTQCKPGYYVNISTAVCEVCTGAPQCTSCFPTNPAICKTCMTGFYITIDGKCIACPAFCQACTNGSVCTGVKSNIGQVVVNVNGISTLAVCDQGCLACSPSAPVSCAVCMGGYTMVKATANIVAYCVACGSNCKTCSVLNLNACTSCFAGYLLSGSTCVGCSQGCLNCEQTSNIISSACTACPGNMLLYNNGTCASIAAEANCGQLCSSCSQFLNGTFYCDICAPGAVMSGGICINCPANCAQCSLSNVGLCTSCLPGYYYSSNQVCTACPQSNCLSCTALACTTCVTGWTLSPSLTCMKQCILPCATCSSTDPSVCLSCIAGFVLNTAATQNCQPDTSCNSNGTCTNCPFGFAMVVTNNSAKCNQCVTSCARCNPNNANQCLSCYTGSYLNGSTCAACPSSCKMCSSPTICFQCASGFVAQQAAVQVSSKTTSSGPIGANPLTCLACTAPCATCYNTPTTCLTCQSGFMLSGNRCLNTNQIDVSVTFTTAGGDNTIFTNNYNTIMTGLANAAGVPQSNIIVSSIVYSSVVFNAIVTINAAANSDLANNIQTSINNYFSTLNITGLTVSQSSIVNPDQNNNGGDTGSGSNATLIIAIVVPIVSVRTFYVI